jgi:hypothetical protein
MMFWSCDSFLIELKWFPSCDFLDPCPLYDICLETLDLPVWLTLSFSSVSKVLLVLVFIPRAIL